MASPPNPARAGHESPFYPSFYPQEIRIETLSPSAAAAGWSAAKVHAYLGDDPFADGAVPQDATAVPSLRAYLVLTFDGSSGRYAAASADARARCGAAGRALRVLAPSDGAHVLYPYPVTPYHADYLQQFDLAQRAQAQHLSPAAEDTNATKLRIRPKGRLAEKLVPASWQATAGEADATLEEIDVGQLDGDRGTGPVELTAAPWIKQGWFQAYLVLASHLQPGAARTSADAAYRRLVMGEYRNLTERINLERKLVATLVRGCERVVVGYTLRREYFNSNYSDGVENVAVDSQSGFISPIFMRTVKLKDFPWNGWLRLGIASKPIAAWNPVAGLGDAFGAALWSALADPLLLREPYGGSWIANRGGIDTARASGTVSIPKDAVRPEAGTGLLRRVGPGKIAPQSLRYAVVASAFHDGTATGIADIVYPYMFAFKWGTASPALGDAFDPAIAGSTALMREWLAGFKVVGVKEQIRDFGDDFKFTYRVPVVDVYLNRRSSDAWEAAAVAPPWSTLPWQTLVLMEEAVQRGIAAFSEAAAKRRGIPVLDLVRDSATGERLSALVDEFRHQGYRPAALADLVTPDEARARWEALAAFHEKYRHFLVTNGPYRLDAWSTDGVALQVFRDLSYPQGLGSFNDYAIPLRAFAAKIDEHRDRIEISAEVERVSKFQRTYEIERVAVGPSTNHAEDHERPICRYVIVGPDGSVARAGTLNARRDGRFVLDLKDLTAAGLYTVVTALYVGGNSVNPEVKVILHRIADGRASRRHALLPRPVLTASR